MTIILVIAKFNKIKIRMTSYISKFKSTPTYSFQSRTKTITKFSSIELNPSPAQYNPQKLKKNVKHPISFAKSQRRQLFGIYNNGQLNRNPGPGNYQTISHIRDGPKITLSSKLLPKANFILKNKDPGPGQYNPSTLLIQKSSPKFSVPNKPKNRLQVLFDQNKYKPEPGHYNTATSDFIIKKQKTRTAQAPRFKSIDIKGRIPGPASYDHEELWKDKTFYSNKSPKLSKSARLINFAHSNASPGPGKYQQKSVFQINKQKQKGYSCRQKNSLDQSILAKQSQLPGPGAYQNQAQKMKFRSIASVKVGKTNRKSFLDDIIKSSKQLPGPGYRDTDANQFTKFKTSMVHKFSKAKLKDTLRKSSIDFPSPSSYKVSEEKLNKFKSSPKFSFFHDHRKTKELDGNKTAPGPNFYNPNMSLVFLSEYSPKLPQSQRIDMTKIQTKTPGPGEYEIPQKNHWVSHHSTDRKSNFPRQKRLSFTDCIIKRNQSSQSLHNLRQNFPNPAKYLNIKPKLKINQNKIKNY